MKQEEYYRYQNMCVTKLVCVISNRFYRTPSITYLQKRYIPKHICLESQKNLLYTTVHSSKFLPINVVKFQEQSFWQIHIYSRFLKNILKQHLLFSDTNRILKAISLNYYFEMLKMFRHVRSCLRRLPYGDNYKNYCAHRLK